MQALETKLDGPILIEPVVHGDERGFFQETYRRDSYAELGVTDEFVQDNHSRSRRGVVRGMHFQPGQAKLVRTARGEILDVLVDIRRDSPSFGRWEGFLLSDANGRQLYAPDGFAHGFCVVSEVADVVYKVSSYYDPAAESGFRYDDPAVGIEWPDVELLASERDSSAPALEEIAADLPSFPAAMKAVILAGGLGTRFAEETELKPKPMIEIGAKPLLWHIMKIFSAQGIDEFVVCLGYRGYMIKEYFANYYLHMGDVTFDLRDNSMDVHQSGAEPWRVTLIDTGEETQTGGRLKRVMPYVGDSDFCFTYGDGVADVDLAKLLAFHREQGCLATVTAVQPVGRWGSVIVEEERIRQFEEKPKGDGGWVNGGFFVLNPDVARYIDGDATTWEREPLQRLAADGQLAAYRHDGFWHAVDTLRDKRYLQEQWDSGSPPWKLWR